MYKYLLLLLLVLQINTLLNGPFRSQAQRKQFEVALDLSGTQIHTLQEQQFREQIFVENCDKIEKLDKETDKDVQLGVNEFTVLTDEEKKSVLAQDRQEVLRRAQKKQIFKNSYENPSNGAFKSLHKLLRKSQIPRKRKLRKSISGATTRNQFKIYWYSVIDNFVAQIQTEFAAAYQQKISECQTSANQDALLTCITNAKSFLNDQLTQYDNRKLDLADDIYLDYLDLRRTISYLRTTKNQTLTYLDSVYSQNKTIILKSIQDFEQSAKDAYSGPLPEPEPQPTNNPFPQGSLFYNLYASGRLEKNWEAEGKVTPVRNQGLCGSCWTFSTTAAIESQRLLNGLSERDLAEQQPLNCALEQYWPNHNSCDGGAGYLAIQSIEKTGIQLETDLPYQGRDNPCTQLDSNDTKQIVKSHSFLTNSGDMAEFLDKLWYRPMAVAFFVSTAFQYYRSGIVNCLDTNFYTGDYNNHEVLVTGYKVDVANPSLSYVRFKNSWGSWGEAGYFKFRLFNEGMVDGQKQILNSDISSPTTQQKAQMNHYISKGPCGLLREKTDTVWVTLG